MALDSEITQVVISSNLIYALISIKRDVVIYTRCSSKGRPRNLLRLCKRLAALNVDKAKTRRVLSDVGKRSRVSSLLNAGDSCFSVVCHAQVPETYPNNVSC